MNIGQFLLYFVPVLSVAFLILHICQAGLVRFFHRLSSRCWALSRAIKAFQDEYQKHWMESQAAIDAIEAREQRNPELQNA